MKPTELEKANNFLKELEQVILGSVWIKPDEFVPERGGRPPTVCIYGFSDIFSFTLTHEEAYEICKNVRARLESELRELGVDID